MKNNLNLGNPTDKEIIDSLRSTRWVSLSSSIHCSMSTCLSNSLWEKKYLLGTLRLARLIIKFY